MENSKRIEKWDILKFFLIFLVVVGHLLDRNSDMADWQRSLFLFIYTFHMPVFVFVSGLFSKRNVDEKRYDKIIGFLFIFFITKIVIFFAKLIAYGKLSFSAFEEGGLPWYMFAMFAFPLITIAVRKISPKYILIFAVILSCVAGYDSDLGELFSIQRIFVFYPFYYLGYCLEPNKIVKALDKKYLKIISAVVLIILALVLFIRVDSCYQFRPILTGRHPYIKLNENNDFGGLYRLAYYLIAFIVGGAVVCLTPNSLGKGKIASMGSRSIQVYILHYPLVYFYDGFIGSKFLPEYPVYIVIGLSVAITLLCSQKFLEAPLSRILNPPLKKK